MIEIWGKPNCPFCEKARYLCEVRGYKFVYKSLGTDFDRDEVLEKFPGAKTFPQITVNGEKVGGYDGFTQYLEETAYTGTGETL